MNLERIMRTFRNTKIGAMLIAAASVGLVTGPAAAQPAPADPARPAAPKPVQLPEVSTELPEELKGITIIENLNLQLPLDLEFTNEAGETVQLGRYFDGQRPVILTLVYFGCPMLCGLVSNAQLQAMKDIEGWTPGKEYQAVTVSFDPRETHELAAQKKQNYVNEYGDPAVAQGWHFLTGRQDQIEKLAAATGFRYRWDEKTKQFAHAAALMIVTPDGRLSRYLHGVGYDPKVLRLSLVEASQGKIGTTTDHVLLYCFQYDPARGAYTLAARNLMAAGAALTVIIMTAWLVPVWVRGSRRRRENEGGVGRQMTNDEIRMTNDE